MLRLVWPFCDFRLFNGRCIKVVGVVAFGGFVCSCTAPVTHLLGMGCALAMPACFIVAWLTPIVCGVAVSIVHEDLLLCELLDAYTLK